MGLGDTEEVRAAPDGSTIVWMNVGVIIGVDEVKEMIGVVTGTGDELDVVGVVEVVVVDGEEEGVNEGEGAKEVVVRD